MRSGSPEACVVASRIINRWKARNIDNHAEPIWSPRSENSPGVLCSHVSARCVLSGRAGLRSCAPPTVLFRWTTASRRCVPPRPRLCDGGKPATNGPFGVVRPEYRRADAAVERPRTVAADELPVVRRSPLPLWVRPFLSEAPIRQRLGPMSLQRSPAAAGSSTCDDRPRPRGGTSCSTGEAVRAAQTTRGDRFGSRACARRGA